MHNNNLKCFHSNYVLLTPAQEIHWCNSDICASRCLFSSAKLNSKSMFVLSNLGSPRSTDLAPPLHVFLKVEMLHEPINAWKRVSQTSSKIKLAICVCLLTVLGLIQAHKLNNAVVNNNCFLLIDHHVLPWKLVINYIISRFWTVIYEYEYNMAVHIVKHENNRDINKGRSLSTRAAFF